MLRRSKQPMVDLTAVAAATPVYPDYEVLVEDASHQHCISVTVTAAPTEDYARVCARILFRNMHNTVPFVKAVRRL